MPNPTMASSPPAARRAPCACAARHQLRHDTDADQETRDALAPLCPHHPDDTPAARPAWMASRMHTRPLAVICADARRAGCGQCRAPAGIPCVLGSLGTTGYHVARFAAAYKAWLISGPDFTAVTDAATVFTGSTIVFGGAR